MIKRFSSIAPVCILVLLFISMMVVVPLRLAASTSFDHVFIVMMENKNYDQVIGSTAAPTINGIANANSNATNYHGVIHPSVNNYVGFVSGQTYSNITDSCTPGGTCSTSAANLADQLEGVGKTWKGYFEDMPSPCFTGYSSGKYVARHNPFVYFSQIRTNSTRCNRMVPYTQLSTDLGSAASTPNFVWITPNLCNDMHDCSVATGDTWLKNQLPAITGSAAWMTQHSLLIVTCDEDNFTSANHTFWVAESSPSAGQLSSGTNYNHYNSLRTLEDNWGLSGLANAANAAPMTDLLGGAVAPSPSPTPSASPSPSPSPSASPSPSPSPSPNLSCNLATPIRAAFYYPWYSQNWGTGTPQTQYHPWLGYYNTNGDYSVVRAQIAAMQYAKVRAGIASWWGQGSYTDGQIANLLTASTGSSATPFCWTLYYEPAVTAGSTQIASDLAYIASHYAGNPNFLHVNSKPVLFVYSRAESSCTNAATWVQTNNGQFYLNLQVFSGYTTCAVQPDNWHQYGPAVAEDHQAGHSFSISPGFFKYNETSPRLTRDLLRWQTNVNDMVASNEPWQLITTFNEFQEGTSVEDSDAWHNTITGESQYLDTLHNG